MTNAKSLIDAAWQARREGRRDVAERDLLEAIGLARQYNLRTDLIRALKALGHVVHDLNQKERALRLYEEALELCRQEHDPLLLAHTVRHLGDMHRGAGRLADADRCYSEALSLYRAALEPPALDFANALRPAALVKEAEGQVEAAKALWSEARRLYQVADVREAVDECTRRLSRLDGQSGGR